MIIEALPDLKTLQCLVLASPSYHAMYANARETILTEFTIRQLESRNINLFQPMRGIFLCHQYYDRQGVKQAVNACVKWIRRPKLFKLNADFCLQLQQLERANLVDEEGFPIPDQENIRQHFDNSPLDSFPQLSIVLVDSQSSPTDYDAAS